MDQRRGACQHDRMESEADTAGSIRTASLEFTPEILKLVAEIDEFKGAWRALGRLAPERLSALRRVAAIESIGSSTRIEGGTLSDREIEHLLSSPDVQALASRDEQEVAGYAAVMETVFESFDAIDLTENHIRQFHRDLLQFTEKDARHRGAYKTLPNHLVAFGPDGSNLGTVFETATPFDTPRRMSALVAWTRTQDFVGTLHPLVIIAVFGVVFLEIHPFQDGNGRLSRILTTLLLLRAGYSYVPYGSLESIIEASKDSYYLALRQTQGTLKSQRPNWQPWLLFFLKALQRQKAHLMTKLEREHLVFGALPGLSVQLLDLCRGHGRLTVAEASKLTGANRNTVKDHLGRLTKAGHLVRHGAGRGTWYALA